MQGRVLLLAASIVVATAFSISAGIAQDKGAGPAADDPLPGTTLPVGGALEGEFIFEQCATCHLPTGSTKTGPDLAGIAGRAAAQLEDFSYSPAMREAAAKGMKWDDTTLDRFLANPTATVPGTSMSGKPLADAQDRADVIAYMKTL